MKNFVKKIAKKKTEIFRDFFLHNGALAGRYLA
jgi:hypothetical protein